MYVEAALLLPSEHAAALAERVGAVLGREPAPVPAGPLSRRLAATTGVVREAGPTCRGVRAEDLRISLVALGDVSGPLLGRVRVRLAAVLRAHGPVVVSLAGVTDARRRSGERGACAAVKVGGDVDGLRALHDDVVAAVAPLGLYLDRRTFVPRVVVATAPAPTEALDRVCADLRGHHSGELVLGQVALLTRGAEHDGGADATRLPLGA